MSPLHKRLLQRQALKKSTRNFFESRGYVEVDTPIITKCPGTEVHLQYFETNWLDYAGQPHQRWLRSSPELHMKRVMAEGIEAIFQVAPCFRNGGEFSEWHNPEFMMLEWYRKGLSYENLIQETETYLRASADDMAVVTGVNPKKILPEKFERIGVFEAFREWAGLSLIDGDPELAGKAISAGVISVQPGDDFETAYFKTLIEKIEPRIFSIGGCVLMDYPPSQAALSVVDNGKACRFEFYLGRIELCNGFFELTGEENNRARIGELLRERVRQGFSAIPEEEDFYVAMRRFTEPCGGNALGFDRWLALLLGASSLDSARLFRGI